MCGSRDLFVLENRIIQLFRGLFLISMPHKVNLTGIYMFKRQIVDFSKYFEKIDFLKMRKKIYKLRKFECLMFFQTEIAPLITPVPHFNKICALPIFFFFFKNIDFCTFSRKTRFVKENYF